MKRRTFMTKSAAGAVGIGTAGCSSVLPKKKIQTELSPLDFEKKVKKPIGTMPMGELGTTGIKVSKFGFGSHIRSDIIKYEKERRRMFREAYDLGINVFDVYDREGESYQYEPTGRHLAPVINDVLLSISILPWAGRSIEKQFEHDLRLFGRDYMDMVRIHTRSRKSDEWCYWDQLFKWKEQGKIRAVGVPIHNQDDLIEIFDAALPLDFVIFPYNFYHNWTWLHKGMVLDEFDSLVPKLKEKGIAVITMKPFAGDHLIYPFRKMAEQYDPDGEINLAKASLRYVINSGIDPDITLGGMYYPYHVFENVDAYFNPAMSAEEKQLLMKLRRRAKVVAHSLLPEHYKFLEDWSPPAWDDNDMMV